MNVGLGRSRVAPILVLLARIITHLLLDHERVELNARILNTSTIVGVVNALVLEALFNLKLLFSFVHDLLCSQDLCVGGKVVFFNLLDSCFILGLELVEFLVVHLTNSRPLVSHVRLNALSFKVVADHLVLKLVYARDRIQNLDNSRVWINVLVFFGSGKLHETLHVGIKCSNEISAVSFKSCLLLILLRMAQNVQIARCLYYKW